MLFHGSGVFIEGEFGKLAFDKYIRFRKCTRKRFRAFIGASKNYISKRRIKLKNPTLLPVTLSLPEVTALTGEIIFSAM